MNRFLLILLVGWTSISLGQTRITVKDASEGLPLPYAHVTYSKLDGTDRETKLTDESGELVITAEYAKSNKMLRVEISFIGMATHADSIQVGADYEFKLTADEQLLNEVVVTAQYAPNSPEKAVHAIRVIDEKKIEQMAAVNLEDVLTNELNIRISQDAVLGSSIKMQGISGENIKIMIDGVPLIGRQNGNFDLNQINLNNIERIEIVEGPLSVNYGTNALAGTINLITKKKSKYNTEIKAESYNETIGTHNLSASINQRWKKLNIAINGGRNFFNGWQDGDAIEPNAEQPVADSSRVQQWKPRIQQFGRLVLTQQLKNLTLNARTELFDEYIINRGAPWLPYRETAFDDEFNVFRFDQALSVNAKLSQSLRFNAVAAYNYYNRIKNTYITDLTTLDKTLSPSVSNQDTSSFQQWMSRGSIISSKDSSWLNWEIGYDINHEFALGQRIDSGSQTMTDLALFATSEIYALKRKLTVRPGIRYAYNTIYKAPITPSLNVRWQPNKWTFRASYARGFRAPSLKELYFNFVDINHDIVGNQDLSAEYSHNFSAKANYKKLIKQSIIQTEVSAYFNQIENLITLAVINQETQEYSYVNIGQQQTQGVNGKFSFMHQHLKANLGLGIVGVRSLIAIELNENQTDYYPELTGNLNYYWDAPKITTSIFYKYQGTMPVTGVDANGDLTQNYVEDYHMIDANVSRSFLDKMFTISVGAKNLLNVKRVASSASTGGAHSGGSSSLPIGMGRFYFLKANLQLSK